MIKNRLQYILLDKNISLRELAKLTGIHYTTLYRLSRDQVGTIHKATLSQICKVLEIQPGDVFYYEEED